MPGRRSAHRWIGAFALTALITACGGGTSGEKPVPTRAANHLYTQTNDSRNAIVHFVRHADGRLQRQGTTDTGGPGTNGVKPDGKVAPDPLESQHAVIVSPDASKLFAVNAGDHSISVFAIAPDTGTLTLLKRTSTTAGQAPNSLAYRHGHLYATFLKGPHRLAAFKVHADGGLAEVGSYELPLLANETSQTAPTQLIVTPDAKRLVVSAGIPGDAFLSYGFESDGRLGEPVTSTMHVKSPFAGVFVPRAKPPIYLSTNIRDVSLDAFRYAPEGGSLTRVSQVRMSGVKDPCWISITPDGNWAYVGNGSGAISSFEIGADGSVTLLNAKAASEPSVLRDVPSVAGDSWISPDGRFLYSTYLGADKVVAYRIGHDGALDKINEVTVGTATGVSLQGLVGL